MSEVKATPEMTPARGHHRVMIRLRGPEEQHAHGVGPGHDEAGGVIPVAGGWMATCSCSALVIVAHEDHRVDG